MKFVKPCCNKVNGYMQDELGKWKATGKVGNMTIRSERHAENMVMQRGITASNHQRVHAAIW